MIMSSKRELGVQPLPEIVEALRTGGSVERWTVEQGSTGRGDAFTDFGGHTLRTPFINDEKARLVRLHELTHTRVSPMDMSQLEAYAKASGFDQRTLECAEEFRVNTIVGKLDYDINLLADGSEKESGKRLGKEALVNSRAKSELFAFGGALVGTKAFNSYVAGVKSSAPELALELREMSKQIKKVVRNVSKRYLGDTTPKEPFEGITLPYGFLKYTTQIAKIIRNYQGATEEYVPMGGVPIETGYGSGVFAPLVVGELPLTRTLKGKLARRKRPAVSGKRVMYPNRMLIDPQKRVFSQKPRNSGGIVLFDLSGSMDLQPSQVEEILTHAPGALILGYSHNRSMPKEPNLWVLANRGKVVDDSLISTVGGRGNCVDGPALDYAISKRRHNEPIVWVCDGQITDSQDKLYLEGAEACAKLVMKHNVIVAPNTEAGIKALKAGRSARSKVEGVLAQYIPKSKGGEA
jgi:hypothetical protein